ncbi:unnamed protein product, partial [Musa acuminata subsp. burmannicoides]
MFHFLSVLIRLFDTAKTSFSLYKLGWFFQNLKQAPPCDQVNTATFPLKRN